MLAKDFMPTFNAAVQAQDWPLVIVLGEAAVAENAASNPMIYNLGLAYLKTSKASMAVSVFLGVPQSERDAAVTSALNEALRLSGASESDFDLGAHGFTGVMTSAARGVDALDPYSWSVVSLGVLIICGCLSLVKIRKFNDAGFKKILKVCGALSALIFAAGMSGVALNYFYQSHWGAIVADAPAPVRVSANVDSEALKTLKPGKPVLVLGDATMPWVRVIESDGASGWMNALDLRVLYAKN